MSGLSAGPLDPAAIFAPLDDYPRLGLAVSGGADSLAVMLLAARYATTPQARQRFFVYSVDHGLRPEAAGEVAFVCREAEKLGFHARPLRWEGEKPQTGIQQAARKARYTLIAGTCNWSSWSLRPYMALSATGADFETVVIRLRVRPPEPITTLDEIRKHSPSGRVPSKSSP